MSSSSLSINEVLKQSDSLVAKLITRAQALNHLQKSFVTVLDNELIPYCRIGCYDLGVLTLLTPNAAWATRLRYASSDMLSKLRSIPQWAGISSIQVKIQKPDPTPASAAPIAPEYRNPPKLSAHNSGQLQALADELRGKPGMDKLVESLERLAGKGSPSSGDQPILP
jgi:hypothetical protein